MYDNIDSNASFQYKISQKDTINQINIRITNQDNEDISTLGEWNMTMQFERHDDDRLAGTGDGNCNVGRRRIWTRIKCTHQHGRPWTRILPPRVRPGGGNIPT